MLITLANYFLLVSPEHDQARGQAAQQRQLDSQLQEKSEIAQNLNERRREMDVLQQKLDEALSELPESADLDELLAPAERDRPQERAGDLDGRAGPRGDRRRST